MNQSPLTFNTKSPNNLGVVRQWHPQAIEITDSASLDQLAHRLDAQAGRVIGVEPGLGFTVRARTQTSRGWEVCEFTYPMDQMPGGENIPLSGTFLKEVIEQFREYLANSDVPYKIDVLMFERFDHVVLPTNPQHLAIIQQVRQTGGQCSVADIQNNQLNSTLDVGLSLINTGAILGTVVDQPNGPGTIALHEEILTGHLMEMIAAPDGQRVVLHPELDNLSVSFNRYRHFADRQALSKRVLRPDQFLGTDPAPQFEPSSGPKI